MENKKMINENALIESRTMRDFVVDRIEVLEKVKKLTLLPDDLHVTVEMAANYYDVDKEAIQKIIQRHRQELKADGLTIIKGRELQEFIRGYGQCVHDLKFAPQLTFITRRALLRIGMLLRDSEVAKMVRSYLLNVEEIARKEAPKTIQAALIETVKEMQAALMKASDTLHVIEADRVKWINKANELTEENKELKPKAGKYDEFMNSEGLFDWDAASSIFGIGKIKMLEALRDKGILQKRCKNLAYRIYEESGWFVTKIVSTWTDRDGIVHEKYKSYVTPKGMDKLGILFKKLGLV